MNALEAYLRMGGYAAFIWPAYGAAFAVLGGLAHWSWRSYRRAVRTLDRLQPDAEK